MTLHFVLFHCFLIFSEKYLQLDLKFTQLDKKYEDLSRENLNLKTRIEALDKENRDIKDQLQSESTQINYQLQSQSKQIKSQLQSKGKQINSHHREDYTDKKQTKILLKKTIITKWKKMTMRRKNISNPTQTWKQWPMS